MALSVEKERKGDVMLPSDNHSLPHSSLLVQYYKWLLLIISKISDPLELKSNSPNHTPWREREDLITTVDDLVVYSSPQGGIQVSSSNSL